VLTWLTAGVAAGCSREQPVVETKMQTVQIHINRNEKRMDHLCTLIDYRGLDTLCPLSPAAPAG
jgi:hypothetical protein